MNACRLLPVGEQGPLQASQQLLHHLWRHADLNGLLIPTWDEEKGIPEPALLEDSSHLDHADPFAPFMPHNAAGKALAALQQLQGRRIALAMRPCELLSFRKLAQRKDLDPSQALLISTDCLSAFALDDTEWRKESDQDPRRLTQEVLHFAAQGGILASRFRGSCQFCDQIIPENIDVHIGVLGLETSKHMLVAIRDPALDQDLVRELRLVSDVPTDISQRRERVLNNLSAWRKRTWEQALSSLDMSLATPEALSEHLASCTACRHQLVEHCPSFEPAWLTLAPEERLVEALAWVTSCGGCGTCEYSCPDDYPLLVAIWFLRQTTTTTAG